MYADIIIDITHEKLDKVFQYRIPSHLEGMLKVGTEVVVPFGKGNKEINGYVTGFSERAEYAPEKIKEIIRIADESVAIESRLVALAAWMKESYGGTMIQALKTVLPIKKKERAKTRAEAGETTVTNRIEKQIEAATGFESRTVVPGHILRGGSPSAYDRVLATKFGARAAMLIKQEKYGYTVAKIGSKISENKLSDVTMKTKFVPENDELVITGKSIGVSFGD